MRIGKTTTALILTNGVFLGIIVWQAQLLNEQRFAREPAIPPPALAPPSGVSSAGHPPARGPLGDDPAGERSPRDQVDEKTGWTEPIPDAEPASFHWRDIESEDYRSYVENLRAIGVPEETVRDIVLADVVGVFADKRNEVMAERFENFVYWKSDEEEANARALLEQRRREVDEWMGAVVRELVGDETLLPPAETQWQRAALTRQLSFLSPGVQEEVMDVLLNNASVDRQFKDLVDHPRIMDNPEERLRLLEAYDLKREELHALLTPQEYELVDMTVSWTAGNLRKAMTNFQPTEEEFRVIFREWRAQDENLLTLFAHGEPSPGKEHVFANIAESLTPERYALYRETWWK